MVNTCSTRWPKLRRMPPYDYLHQCFDYDPETGVLTWRQRPIEHATAFANKTGFAIHLAKCAGKPAGTFLQSGHLCLRLDGVEYRIHRIIWKWMTGEEPPEVDHEDTDPATNRWENLRTATEHQNRCNRGAQRNNTSGYKGVTWNKINNKWKAQIKSQEKNYNLGDYSTIEEAAAAYQAAAPVMHGAFARTHTHTDIIRPDHHPHLKKGAT